MTQTELRPTTAHENPAAADDGCACPGACGSTRRSMTRRAAIGTGVLAGAAFVTACGSSDTATNSPTTSTTAASSSATSSAVSSAAETPSATSAPSSAADTSSAAGSSAAPAGTEIAKVSDIPSGGSVIVANGDEQIALARNADGTVVAHSAICTHQGCAVNADGASLKCPCHGSTFDAFTGAVIKAPANAPLAEISVEVSGEAVYLTT